MKHPRIATLVMMTLFTAVALTLGGCSATPTAKLDKPRTSASAEVPSFSKTLRLNQILDLYSIKLRIDSVSLIKNSTESQADLQGHLALGLELGNISSEDVRFDPEQFEVTTNTGEQLLPDTSDASDTGSIFGGLLPPKRVLQGYVMFPLHKSNPDDITEIKLNIKAPQNEKGQPLCDDQELVIPIPQS